MSLAGFFRAEVAERQTRCVQVAVSLRMCGFKSLPRHQKANSTQPITLMAKR